MKNWLYQGKEIKEYVDFPQGIVGFVYCVTFNDVNKKYIGKKSLFHKKTLPPLKGKKRKRVEYKESDWKTYFGSSLEGRQIINDFGSDNSDREILYLCYSKKEMTYLETKMQFELNCLENEEYINDNIMSRFFKKDIDKFKKDIESNSV